MTVLALLRHAKAVKQDPGGDHARPLIEAGRLAAGVAGERLRHLLPAGVLVVASDARRTRETAELAFPAYARSRLRLEPSLYAAGPASLLGFVRSLPADLPAAVMVGHNPGFSELASLLAGSGDPTDLARVSEGLATADAVVFDLAGGWANAGSGAGRVVSVLAREDMDD